MNAIICTQVSKTFGDIKALDQVTLSFEEGKIYGLLGRNGAGKTTFAQLHYWKVVYNWRRDSD